MLSYAGISDVYCKAEDLKKAYKDKLKYYHPDRHADNETLQKIATDKTRQVVEAYNLIVKFLEE